MNMLNNVTKLCKKGICQGACSTRGDCKGSIKVFRVIDNRTVVPEGELGEDFGLYSYCETAVKIDIDNGFVCSEEVENELG